MKLKLSTYEDTNWIILNNIIQYRKVNGVVYMVLENSNKVNAKANEYTTVGTLPVGFRPRIATPMFVNEYGGEPFGTSSRIDPTGEIKIYITRDSSYFQAIVSFPI